MIEPPSIALVIPDALTLSESELISIEESSTFTSNVFPVLPRPSPAVIEPAPLNWLKAKLLVPTTSEPALLVQTQPVSAADVPSSINMNAPAAASPVGISSARDQESAELT